MTFEEFVKENFCNSLLRLKNKSGHKYRRNAYDLALMDTLAGSDKPYAQNALKFFKDENIPSITCHQVLVDTILELEAKLENVLERHLS